MSENNQDRRRTGFTFDINLGNILTIIIVIVGMSITWGQASSRITALETITQQHEKIIVELQITNAKLTALTEMYIPQLQRILEAEKVK